GDAGVAQAREDLGLALEQLERLPVGRALERQDLDRDLGFGLAVDRPIGVALAPEPEGLHDLVALQALAGHGLDFRDLAAQKPGQRWQGRGGWASVCPCKGL